MSNKQTTCPHCTQETLFYVTAASCHCINPACPADHVTLPEAEFMALTPTQLERYTIGRTPRRQSATQDDKLVQAAAVREAARLPGEKLFG